MLFSISCRRLACKNIKYELTRQRFFTTKPLQVWQYPASDDDETSNGVLYDSLVTTEDGKWNRLETETNASKPNMTVDNTISHFLPAHYPSSVATGYLPFATYCFTASVAGSASMVLSTQTLLLAVGVVGTNAQQASIMAGAFNWVMKDFVGQLGGVLFASQMGKTKAFDNDPKRWRMVSAMTLDGATLLEILSPLFHSSMVLPVASVANVGKNIGFLTASASRAAIHQSLATSGNLGDVTAKAGSQAILASLVGTTLGIGLSSLLSHDTYKFSVGFCVLAGIHQGFNYLSLKHVPLAHFNRQRLCIVLKRYIETNEVLSPIDVAKQEAFVPLFGNQKKQEYMENWLSIGSPLTEICPDPSKFETLLRSDQAQYLLRSTQDGKTHLAFFKNVTGEDVIFGVLNALLLHKNISKTKEQSNIVEDDSYKQTKEMFQTLLEQLHEHGWNTSTKTTSIESKDSFRFSLGSNSAGEADYPDSS